MSEKILYRPKELYKTQLKDQYHKGAEKYFDDLTKESKVNKEANKIHVQEYREAEIEEKDAEKKRNSARGLKIFVLVMSIISLVVSAVFLFLGIRTPEAWYCFLVMAFLLALGILGIVWVNVSLKKKQAAAQNILDEKKEATKQKYQSCVQDMAPLNALFDWNAPAIIMEKATPIIDLDPVFSNKRLDYLMNHYGLKEETSPDVSVVGITSGEIQGNPFILEKVREHTLGTKTYHGELVISWTETYTDKDGTHTRTRTQTLHASVTKPCPYYGYSTRLIYGNDAAPRLHFSRMPNSLSSKGEKDKEKGVSKKMKELRKRAEKEIMDGKKNPFSPMDNEKFEVLFGAEDRDNEVEFRLLYTPLAMENTLALLEDKTPFGDDFVMVKDGMINSIASQHSQSFDYSANPANFAGFDYEKMRENFITYCDAYIEHLFFDLAPLLSIPLYQMHKSQSFIYKSTYKSNVTSFEQEVMANGMSEDPFYPEDASRDLPLMLKAISTRKEGKSDRVDIMSYSYQTIERVDYIPVHGGDGFMHDVPVYWTEYIPVEKSTPITVREVGGSRPAYMEQISQATSPLRKWLGDAGYAHYERGLIGAFVPFETQNDEIFLASLFKEKETGDNKK